MPPIEIGGRSPNISEELRRHAIAPSGGVPLNGLYASAFVVVNTRKPEREGFSGETSVSLSHLDKHGKKRLPANLGGHVFAPH
jgi:hypothetical protein